MKKVITIESILNGISESQYFASPGQYQSAYGIDPDAPIREDKVRSSGFIRPTAMAKFSGTEITGVPLWFITNPKTTNTYLYANDGKVHTIDSALAMGTALNSGTALSSSSGNGAEYYDNYIYFAKNTDIARYGPLNGSPSLTQTYWTSTLSKTALVDTPYPSLRGVELPNHVMHRHTDNKLYIADVVGNQGNLHYIETSKTSVEGDTDAGSTYSALDLPYGWYPTAIESYGTDLAVASIEGISTTTHQKNAKVTFWDTTSVSFTTSTDVEFPDPLITALRNVNGTLYVFSGNASGGCRVSRMSGSYSFQEVYYDEDGLPPLAGAVDHILSKILWGSYVTDPAEKAVVKGLGSKRLGFMPSNAMSVPYTATSSTTTNQWVTALKFVQDTFLHPVPIIGWSNDSAKGLDKKTTTHTTAVWQSEVFRVGRPFQIESIYIPLSEQLDTGMEITVSVHADEEVNVYTYATINTTNQLTDMMNILLEEAGAHGRNDFYIEISFSGTALVAVKLPIIINLEVLDYGQDVTA
jgi:hypothetical protein